MGIRHRDHSPPSTVPNSSWQRQRWRLRDEHVTLIGSEFNGSGGFIIPRWPAQCFIVHLASAPHEERMRLVSDVLMMAQGLIDSRSIISC